MPNILKVNREFNNKALNDFNTLMWCFYFNYKYELIAGRPSVNGCCFYVSKNVCFKSKA